MNRHHLISLLGVAALSLSLPVAGPAAAAGSGKGKSAKTKPAKAKGKGKAAKSCKGGKGYEVQGVLLEGSSLGQVAGAGTARRSDDRWAGTLVIDVQQGNKRGRADRGVRSYELASARMRGADGTVPDAGARVTLVGKLAGAKCAGAARVRVEQVAFKPARDWSESEESEGSDDAPEVEDEAPEEEPEFDEGEEQPEGEEPDDDFFADRR